MKDKHALRLAALIDRIGRLEGILVVWEHAGAEVQKCTLYGPADGARGLIDRAAALTREYQKQYVE